MAPTPTITPWPGMRRGTEWTVPIVPGLVRLTVTPAKSSTETLSERTLRLTSTSFAGTTRALVAVGTERLVSMFVAVRAAAPRRASASVDLALAGSALAGSALAGAGAAAGPGAGAGAGVAAGASAAAGAG